MNQKDYMKGYHAGAKGEAKHGWETRKKIKKMTPAEAGAKGEKIAHRRRYELLTIISGQADKNFLNRVMGWPTKFLEALVEFNKLNKHG